MEKLPVSLVSMKSTNLKRKQELKIKRRLELVRTKIRELTPAQLRHVNGGYTEEVPTCYAGSMCNLEFTI
jgi:hypothetical protein